MKMKSAKKKSLQNKNKTGEQQQDLVIVKTESELEEGSHEVCIRGDGFNIQIKEEPHSQEISEEHNGDLSGCPDTKPGTVSPGSDIHEQEHIKEERDSDQVKEELESLLKEEKDSGGEAEEREEVCTGSSSSLHNV